MLSQQKCALIQSPAQSPWHSGPHHSVQGVVCRVNWPWGTTRLREEREQAIWQSSVLCGNVYSASVSSSLLSILSRVSLIHRDWADFLQNVTGHFTYSQPLVGTNTFSKGHSEFMCRGTSIFDKRDDFMSLGQLTPSVAGVLLRFSSWLEFYLFLPVLS